MLDAVHASLNRRKHCLLAVRVRHDGKALFVGDVNHLAHLGGFQIEMRDAPELVEVHDAGGHNLDEIGTLRSRLFHKCRISTQILERTPHDGTIPAFAVDGENGRTVVDAILGSNALGQMRHAVLVAPVAHKCHPMFAIGLEACANMRLVRPVGMARHALRVVHAIHCNMRMTFAEHRTPSFAIADHKPTCGRLKPPQPVVNVAAFTQVNGV